MIRAILSGSLRLGVVTSCLALLLPVAAHAQNQAPVITIPASFTGTEDTLTLLPGISVADPDAGTSNITIQVQCVSHTLTVTQTVGLVSVVGNNSSSITLTGPQSAQNGSLASLRATFAANFNGNATLSVNVNDNGFNGSGGAKVTNVTRTIAVSAVNDRPVLSSVHNISSTEDSSNNVAIVLSDVDITTPADAALTYNVSLSCTNGTLRSGIDPTNITNLVTFTVGRPSAITNKAVAFNGAYSNVVNVLQTLYYVPVRDFNGNDTLAVSVNDNGNIGTGGALTTNRNITISLSAVNDPPRLNVITEWITDEDTALVMDLSDIDEADIGETPGAELRASVSTSNGILTLGSLSGITVTNGANASALIQFRGLLASVTNALFGLTFSPAANFFGTTTVQIAVNDNGATGAGGVLGVATTLVVTVNSVNDAPTLNNAGALTISSINENDTNSAGVTVATLMGVRISDNDAGALQGVAAIGAVATGGVWQFSLDGSTWTTFGALAPATATLLAPTNSIRFVPNLFFSGSATIVLRAWDQSDAAPAGATEVDASTVGGSTPFSVNSITGTIAVVDLNNAPTLDNADDLSLTGLDEDPIANPGDTVSAILASAGGAPLFDGDPGTQLGIAVVGADTANGSWQYSTNGGGTFASFGALADASATLLSTSSVIRFVPNAGFGGSATVTFRGWDRTSGSVGQAGVTTASNGGTNAFSSATETAVVAIASLNDAPLLDNSGTMTLTSIDEDDTTNTGNSVASIILSAGGDRITDSDAGAQEGIAVVGVDDTNGQWEFSIDAGANWSPFGPVAVGSATVLDDAALIRFVPTAQYNGSASFTFHAWDRTDGEASGTQGVAIPGTGGTNAYSTASEIVSITVSPVNDAPEFDASGDLTLTAVAFNNTNSAGNTVAQIIASSGGDRITDVDAGAVEGVAVVGADQLNGTWQVSLDGGATWVALAAVSPSSARLLDAAARVRFVPNANFAGSASITLRAWDQTSGSNGQAGVDTTTNGGSSSFSTTTDFAVVTVTGNLPNSAPVLDASGTMTLPAIVNTATNNGGASVASIIASAGGDRITDSDIGAVEGIAVVGRDNANGTWQFSLDNGVSWTPFGALANASATLLNQQALVRFVPNFNFSGSATISFRAWDQTVGLNGQAGVSVLVNGGTNAYSVATESASIAVSFAANAAPVLDNSGSMVLPVLRSGATNNPGATVASIIGSAGGDRITDADPGALEGIAVIARDNANGAWEFSVNGGASWTAFGAVANASATLLNPAALLRFNPNPGYVGLATITFRAWDQSTGANGQTLVNATVNGGATPFSTASEQASIRVSSPLIARNDFDGDGRSDLGVIRTNNWTWSIRLSGGGTQSNVFGFSRSVEVNADYDGDGKADVAVFDPRTGTWSILRSNLGFLQVAYGYDGVQAVPADYDGDATANLAVFDPRNGTWYVDLGGTNGTKATQFGYDGVIPVPADYNGDGTADLAVYDPANGTWYILIVSGNVRTTRIVQWGYPGVTPVPADYDGDGITDIGVFDPRNQFWYLSRSTAGSFQIQYGFRGVIPVPGDYDGDQVDEVGVYSPTQRAWYSLQSTAGQLAENWGLRGSVPVGPAP